MFFEILLINDRRKKKWKFSLEIIFNSSKLNAN